MPTVYFDACCLNRPFDDQSQERVRLEAEAILLLLARVQRGDLRWVGSEVLIYEISRTPDPERRRRVERLLRLAVISVAVGPGETRRATELEALGFGSYDALHLACAERGGAEVVLTTDDGLIRRVRRHAPDVHVRVKNPLTWMNESTEGT